MLPYSAWYIINRSRGFRLQPLEMISLFQQQLDVSGYGATVGMLGVEFRRACDSVLYRLSWKKTFRFFCGGDVVHTRKHLVDTFVACILNVIMQVYACAPMVLLTFWCTSALMCVHLCLYVLFVKLHLSPVQQHFVLELLQYTFALLYR